MNAIALIVDSWSQQEVDELMLALLGRRRELSEMYEVLSNELDRAVYRQSLNRLTRMISQVRPCLPPTRAAELVP